MSYLFAGRVLASKTFLNLRIYAVDYVYTLDAGILPACSSGSLVHVKEQLEYQNGQVATSHDD